MVTARKFEELDVTGGEELTRPDPVEESPRQLAPPVEKEAEKSDASDADGGDFKLIGGEGQS